MQRKNKKSSAPGRGEGYLRGTTRFITPKRCDLVRPDNAGQADCSSQSARKAAARRAWMTGSHQPLSRFFRIAALFIPQSQNRKIHILREYSITFFFVVNRFFFPPHRVF